MENTAERLETLPAALDSTLRQLLGRLCLAGLGRSAELDAQLRGISQMARAGLDAGRIQACMEPLTRAVAALDALAPVGAGTTLPADAPAADAPAAGADASGIRDQRAQLLREKAEIEALLQQLDSRLETIAAYFAFEEQQHTATRTDTDQLNKLVLGEVREISVDMNAASSLQELRGRIGQRLSSINLHIDEYRQRDEARHVEQTSRTQALKLRVEELEQESRVLRQSLREEQRLAQIDTLTGIPNRAAWNERLAREYKRWQRHGGLVSLLLWDVDHFKSINDEYGHKAGDRMLCVLAQHLSRDLRAGDFVARYGGEEFVMLLTGLSADDALRVANRVRAGVLGLAFRFRETPVRVTASCGITTFRMGDTQDSAFERADRALYAAKDAGRNRCIVR